MYIDITLIKRKFMLTATIPQIRKKKFIFRISTQFAGIPAVVPCTTVLITHEEIR